MAEEGKTTEEIAENVFSGLQNINPNEFKLIVLSKFVEKSSVDGDIYIFKLQETPYWDNAKWQESMKKEVPDEEMNYVKGWYVSQPDIQLLEMVLDAVKV